jgi:hypothetical protein
MSAGAASDALAPQVCNTLLTPRLLHGSAALGLRGPRDSETRQQDTGGANGATPRSAVSRRSTVGNRLDYRPDASRRRADGSFCRTGLLRPRKPRGVRNAPSPEWPVSTSGRTCRTCRTCRHLPHSGLATKTVVRVATESRLHTTRQGHPRESPGSTAITSPGHHVAWLPVVWLHVPHKNEKTPLESSGVFSCAIGFTASGQPNVHLITACTS